MMRTVDWRTDAIHPANLDVGLGSDSALGRCRLNSSKIALKGTPLNAAAPEAVFWITLPAGPGRM